MNGSTNDEAHKEVVRCVTEAAKRRLGCCLVVEDDRLLSFSATFIFAQGKYFLVTAAHCLENASFASTLRVATASHQTPGIEVPLRDKVLFGSAKLNGQVVNLDVGYIELPPDIAEALGVDWSTQEAATSDWTGSGALVYIAGFPGSKARLEPGKPSVYHPQPMVYWGEVTHRPHNLEWGGYNIPPNDSVDVFVEYEAGNHHDAITRSPMEDIDPKGMSGGGVFVVPRPVGDGLWTPSEVHLAGIQSSHVPGDNLVRATRVEHVFHLMEEAGAIQPAS